MFITSKTFDRIKEIIVQYEKVRTKAFHDRIILADNLVICKTAELERLGYKYVLNKAYFYLNNK